jgi:hypothetical protein
MKTKTVNTRHAKGAGEARDDEEKEVIKAWRRHFPDATVEARGVGPRGTLAWLVVTHTLQTDGRLPRPVATDAAGDLAEPPWLRAAAERAVHVAAVRRADAGRDANAGAEGDDARVWENSYRAHIPDAPGTKGRQSSVELYATALKGIGLPACEVGAGSRHLRLPQLAPGFPLAEVTHAQAGVRPADFAATTAKALAFALKVAKRRARDMPPPAPPVAAWFPRPAVVNAQARRKRQSRRREAARPTVGSEAFHETSPPGRPTGQHFWCARHQRWEIESASPSSSSSSSSPASGQSSLPPRRMVPRRRSPRASDHSPHPPPPSPPPPPLSPSPQPPPRSAQHSPPHPTSAGPLLAAAPQQGQEKGQEWTLQPRRRRVWRVKARVQEATAGAAAITERDFGVGDGRQSSDGVSIEHPGAPSPVGEDDPSPTSPPALAM